MNNPILNSVTSRAAFNPRQATTRNDNFGYNDRGELTNASLGTNPYAYAYDNIGNRKMAQEISEGISYDANNINQYTSITREKTAFVPTFDTDGNQTLIQSSTGIWSVVYNADNRPVSFTKTEGDQTTLIECGYDYMGRRYMKKVTVNGAITLHHRYIYRGYLQIACVDLTRNGHPALWLTMWDPSEPIATRPLAIQKNATWYTYGHDLTKNITELYKTDGTIATAYDYTPYGAVTSTGTDQPFQWSSEFYDAELGMVYYNYRHYNPMDGRWINRDPIAEQGGQNLYSFVGNGAIGRSDLLGQSIAAWLALGAFVAWGVCAVHAFIQAKKFANNDKLRHCYASCLISKNCGQITSIATGVIKEITDVFRDKIYELFGGISEAEFNELMADAVGDLHADMLCLNEKDEKGCKCCCNKKISQV